MSAWGSIYSEFSHHYDDPQAIVFTLGRHDRPPPEFEEFANSILGDPTAGAPFTARVYRTTPAIRAFHQRRRDESRAETKFWTQELRKATPGKFLHILKAEKAKADDPPGTHKTTWIFVHYKRKTLNLGRFDWVVGSREAYTKFTKAESRSSFY